MNAIFLMHPGTYGCYHGLHKNFPYLWSEPSDVLMLPESSQREVRGPHASHLLPGLPDYGSS